MGIVASDVGVEATGLGVAGGVDESAALNWFDRWGGRCRASGKQGGAGRDGEGEKQNARRVQRSPLCGGMLLGCETLNYC